MDDARTQSPLSEQRLTERQVNSVDLAHSALINLITLSKRRPALEGDPFFVLARTQLEEALAGFGRDSAKQIFPWSTNDSVHA